MKNKKTTIIITLSAVITSALGILFIFNKVIEKLATSKNLLAEHHHETYRIPGNRRRTSDLSDS